MNKLKETFLLAIVFLFPWQARWLSGNFIYTDIYNEYTLPSLFVIDVLLVFAVIAFFPWSNLRKINNKLLLLILSWLTVNTVFATQPFFVIWKAIFLFALLAFVYTLQKNIDSSKIKATLIFAGVLQAVIGLGQFFLQYIPASTIFGIAEQSADILGSSVVETFDGRWLRAYGTFPHPNIYGGFLALILLLVVDKYQIIYFEFKKWWLVNKKELFTNEDKKYLKITGIKIIFYLVSFLIIFAGLIVSFSRSAWLAFAVGFAVYLILQLKQKYNILPLLKLTFAGAVIGIFFITLYSPLFVTRFSNATRLEIASVEERISGYETYINIFKNNWLVGTGLGNYAFELSRQNPGQPAYIYQPIHNTFLLFLAEVGILGIVLLGYIFSRKKLAWNGLVTSLLVVLIVIGLFDHYLWSVHSGILLIFIAFCFNLRFKKGGNDTSR
jgi:O-antigen ligase